MQYPIENKVLKRLNSEMQLQIIYPRYLTKCEEKFD